MAPKASIVYLTKDGGDLFRRSLEAVFAQEVDFSYEVLVVDSGSMDATLEIVEKFPARVFRIAPEKFNFGLTRDYGFTLSDGEILIALSQDAIPVGREWLRKMVEPFADASVAVVQGHEVLPEDCEVFFWDRVDSFYYTAECRKWMEAYNGIGLSFTSCAIRRIVWERHPLGSVDMSEDKVFQKNVTMNGFRIVYQHKAMNYHSHLYNFDSLAKRCQNEGLGWRGVGVTYALRDMVKDMANRRVWWHFFRGLKDREITRVSEFIFPLVRPLFVYKGNRFSKRYVR